MYISPRAQAGGTRIYMYKELGIWQQTQVPCLSYFTDDKQFTCTLPAPCLWRLRTPRMFPLWGLCAPRCLWWLHFITSSKMHIAEITEVHVWEKRGQTHVVLVHCQGVMWWKKWKTSELPRTVDWPLNWLKGHGCQVKTPTGTYGSCPND